MRKYVMFFLVAMLAAMIAACGGGGDSSKVIKGITIVAFNTDGSDVSGKTFYQLTKDGYRSYTFNADKTASWSSAAVTSGSPTQDVTDGTWSITTAGVLQFVSGSSTYTFTRIQNESGDSYWLAYDQDYSISRLYYDQTSALSSAQAYMASVTVSSGLVRMGGAVQGGSVALTTSNSNVTLFAGALDGIAGTRDTSSGVVARFDQPVDITTDGTNYYVVDYTDYTDNDERNSRIRKIDASGNVTTLSLTDESTGKAVTLENAQGITISPDGKYLFVADTGHHLIRRVTVATSASKIIAGNSGYSAGSVDSTTGTDAYFSSPTGITTDGTNLYVADAGNNTIRKIVISSGAVSTLAGNPEKDVDSDDGTYTDARFYTPVRLTTDGSNLYVTDFGNRTIRKLVIATGKVTTLAGKALELGQIDGSGTAARFYHPHGITTDGTYLYVTDYFDITLPTDPTLTDANKFNNLVRSILISTAQVTTIAGGMSYPEDTVIGLGTAARFAKPRGIVWNGSTTGLYLTNGSESFTVSGATRKDIASAYNNIFRILP